MSFIEHYKKAWSSDSIRLIATPSALAKSTYFYIQEIGYFKTQEHYYTERSNLNSYLMIYTLSGKGILQYEGRSYPITSGQFVWIDCMKPHYYATDTKDLWEILWVHFNGATTEGYYKQFHELSAPIFTLQSSTKIPIYLKTMLQLHKEKHLQNEVLCSNLLMSCLTEVLVQVHTPSSSTQLPSTIKTIQTFIEHHFQDTLTLDILAKEFSISKYHLSRIYKRYTGFSPIDYLISLRINYAKQLLRFSDFTIEQIAYEIGINNTSHFINLFKKREELSPLQFRKKWRNP